MESRASKEYEHACQRAELLGIPAPSREEWAESWKGSEDEDVPEKVVVEELSQTDEGLRHAKGGLDELNSILSVTQKKINRFKTVCGSLGTLLKIRVGSRTNTPDHKPLNPTPGSQEDGEEALKVDESMTVETTETTNPEGATGEDGSSPVVGKRTEMERQVGSHIDKLDSLIAKAENAQYSMQHQSKQMRKFLK